MIRFEAQIQAAFRDASLSGGIPDAQRLVSELRDLERCPDERDRSWSELMDRFRRDRDRPWSALILEALRIDLVALSVAVPLPIWLDRDELSDQIVFEVLTAAVEENVVPARWTPNRLLSRTTAAVYRWMLADIEHQASMVPSDIEDPDLATAAMFSLAEISAEVSAGRLPGSVIKLASKRATGMTVRDLAAEAGISVAGMKKRISRAAARARRCLAA